MAGGMMGGMMGGKGGDSGNSPWDTKFAGEALHSNEQAVHNRYQQLGLGVPEGLDHSKPILDSTFQKVAYGGSAANPNVPSSVATSPTSYFSYSKPSTMEGQDIGNIPTETGGVQGMAHALLGELFSPTNAAGLGPGGSVSQLGQLAQQNQQQQGNADFSSGFQSTQNPGSTG